MVDRFDEGFNVAFLSEDERRREGGIGAIAARIDRNSSGIIAPILEAAEAVEQHFQNVAPLSTDVEIQVGENPAHDFVPTISGREYEWVEIID